MSPAFVVLLNRSIFFKGHLPPYIPGHEGPVAPPVAAAATEPTTAPAESEIVLDGVTEADDQIVAFLEDRSDQKVTLVHVGDSLSHGKVTDITLDRLDYEAAGKVTHVAVGQNLEGEAASAASSSTQPAAASPGGAAAPTPGGAAAAVPASVPGVSNELLERLRRRRQQELQGK